MVFSRIPLIDDVDTVYYLFYLFRRSRFFLLWPTDALERPTPLCGLSELRDCVTHF